MLYDATYLDSTAEEVRHTVCHTKRYRHSSAIFSVVREACTNSVYRWSMASVLFLSSWAVLMGPWIYGKSNRALSLLVVADCGAAQHLVSKERLPFTATYFGAIGMTLWSAVGVSQGLMCTLPDDLLTCTSAAKHDFDHDVLGRPNSRARMVPCQLLPDGFARSSICSEIWWQSDIDLVQQIVLSDGREQRDMVLANVERTHLTFPNDINAGVCFRVMHVITPDAPVAYAEVLFLNRLRSLNPRSQRSRHHHRHHRSSADRAACLLPAVHQAVR